MLRELSVHNLALIEDVRVELRDGFCAWTGETGAGKSLLLGALGLLLGERGSSELIRTGVDDLRVTGVFELNRPDLKKAVETVLEMKLPEGEVIVSRRLQREGGSKCYVNDDPVSVTLLKKLGEVLVDVHGQRESHSLLEPTYQVQLLDAFGKLELLRKDYDSKAVVVRELRRRRAELSGKQESRQKELSLIRFEKEELETAQLQPGEQAELEIERERLIHAQSLQEFTIGAAGRLYDEDGSVVEQLGRLLKEAHTWAPIDPDLAEVAKRLDALVPEVRDIAESCRDLSERFEADPGRLADVEKRIQALKRLEAKYRKSIDDLIAYRDELDAREVKLSKEETDLGGIDGDLQKAHAAMKSAAETLSKGRQKIGKKLVGETQKHLINLGMASARLDCGFEPINLGDAFAGEVPVGGADQLEFLLAANPGEPFRPLRKVASGGEMSRTMLALKTVLAEHDPVGTLVFDEIDANVGGRLGDIVGEKLALLGQTHQVICVTHLPQVACFAAHQWTIRKSTKAKRTSTVIARLESDDDRLEELASMMRGDAKSDTTRQEAAEMLKTARKKAK
ncbi:DNA repair protein RecN [Zavarzinella formosa]|uniref:DNA repair protein RecN n=1 Tax=Zavarzinella formosa TaxID=360055 RepID=UPI000309436C|nr:DNA repair protein RecN [Zavarzinella formosa]